VFTRGIEAFFGDPTKSAELTAVNTGKVGASFKVLDRAIEWGILQIAVKNLFYRPVAGIIIDARLRSMV